MCEIFTVDLTEKKYMVVILQKNMSFSQTPNFKREEISRFAPSVYICYLLSEVYAF